MKPHWLMLVIALQVAWLVGTAFTAQRHLVTGHVVRLETVPVDPRDLLRGDFVILGYEFGRIPPDRFDPPLPGGRLPPPGSPVYLDLAPDGEFHRMTRAYLTPPSLPEGHVMLRGQVVRSGLSLRPGTATVAAEYGLERYYVREGTGSPRGRLTVDVSVSDSGIGQIKEVYVDGVPYVEAMRHQAP